MTTAQPALPIVATTRCGYCDQPLVLTNTRGWRCPRCAPHLARIHTLGQWTAWMRKNRRNP